MTVGVIRVVGAVLILLAALAFIRLYRAYLGIRVELFEGFIGFLRELRRHISTRLASVDDLVRGTGDGVLRRIGFIDAYDRTGGLHSAFAAVKDNLALPEGALRLLDGYFAAFGKGYMAEELAAADAVISELSALASTDRDEGERSLKTVSAFAVALAAGAVVLML